MGYGIASVRPGRQCLRPCSASIEAAAVTCCAMWLACACGNVAGNPDVGGGPGSIGPVVADIEVAGGADIGGPHDVLTGADTAGPDALPPDGKCTQSSDCKVLDDPDACKGKHYCNKSTGQCLINPTTVAQCDLTPEQQATSPCETRTCNPTTGLCIWGQMPTGTPCDDKNSCTGNGGCKGGKCEPGTYDPKLCECIGPAQCAAKEDGNLCNGTLFCNLAAAKCQLNPLTIVTCQTVDDTWCRKNTCNPKTGQCSLLADHVGAPCDDGNPCTAGEVCTAAGNCGDGKPACECQSTADCATNSGGNLCNGLWYCDYAVGKCKLNPATVVNCATVDDTNCVKNQCEPATGTCKMVDLADSVTCDADMMPCTVGDHCQAGKCLPGKMDPVCECLLDADCASKNSVCGGSFYCDKAANKCVVNPATVVQCAPAAAEGCVDNVCNPKTGACELVAHENGAPCGSCEPMLCQGAACGPFTLEGCATTACSSERYCSAGACKIDWKPEVCPCLVKSSDCAVLEDGDLCNGTLYCNAGTHQCEVNPASIVTCPTGLDTDCTKHVCDSTSGTCKVLELDASSPCDDGNLCTVGDVCANGTCQSGAFSAAKCECITSADCVAFDDGNACNGTLACVSNANGAKCQVNPASIPPCEKSTVDCQSFGCLPPGGTCGWSNATNGIGCSDGDACTIGDKCLGGACQPGGMVCECKVDGDCAGVPWADPCVGQVGCVDTAGVKKCAYLPGTAPDCAPSPVPCTTNLCDSSVGKCSGKPLANNTKCEDGDPCTVGQYCLAGACQGGANACQCATDADCLGFEDGNACNGLPYCDLAKTYGSGTTPHPCFVHTTLQVACPPGNGCSSMACEPASGQCVVTAMPCDDGEPCTVDSCNGAACAHAALNGGGCWSTVLGGGGVCKQGVCTLPAPDWPW